MLRNYITIAFRTLTRHKSYTVLNLLGLSLGMGCGIVLFLLIKFHLSTDTYHAKAARIYRLASGFHYAEGAEYTPSVPNGLAKALRNDFPQLSEVVSVVTFGDVLVSVPNQSQASSKKFKEETVVFVEPAFFETFSWRWLMGNPKKALQSANEVVLTQKFARKYFDTQNPIGRTLRLSNRQDVVVTGVVQDYPPNTDLRYDLFVSHLTLSTYNPGTLEGWGGVSSSVQCYVLLPENYAAAQLERAFPAFAHKYGVGDNSKMPFKLSFHAQPLREAHFDPQYSASMSYRWLWAMGLLGLLLVTTACINFVNLATAQALQRSKEVGVRKVLGGTKAQLFSQFMAETTLITLVAAVGAVGVASWATPVLGRWMEDPVQLNLSNDTQLWLFLAGLVVLVSLLAGFYPALVLAGFKPVLALKGKVTSQHLGGISVRRGLVVTQFVISQILIICSLVVAQQMEYTRQANLGFRKDAIVMLPVPSQDTTNKQLQTFKNRLLQIPGVEKVSYSYTAPAASSNNTTNIRFGSHTKDEPFLVNAKIGDADYLSMYGLQLVAGRNLVESDTVREMLVNETLLRKLNVKPEEAIGQTITLGHDVPKPIVGVVKDFHLYSLKQAIGPCFITTHRKMYGTAGVKMAVNHIPSTMKQIERIWASTFPDQVYEYHFLDESIAEFYKQENILLRLINTFASIAIVIGCLGLYGLVSFMVETKTTEVGIRKVLGATVGHILVLFGREFFKLIFLAFFVSVPVAWWLMNKWLQDYEYRMNLGLGIFLLGMLITLMLAAFTVGYRSFKAAIANPVDSLRAE